MGKAVSLWIASNFKREAELPQGAKDPTRGEGQPDAHYYAVASGVQFVNPVLARALRDHNAQVAFKAIRALEVTAGASSLFSGEAGQPIIDALAFPDKAIRFEAAYAIGSAVPQQDFQGKDRVVQILADALNATGKPNVLVVLPSQNDVNAMAEGLNGQVNVVGATSATAAIDQSQKLPGVDYIIVSEDLPEAEVNRVFDAANTNPRLRRRLAHHPHPHPRQPLRRHDDQQPHDHDLAGAGRRRGRDQKRHRLGPAEVRGPDHGRDDHPGGRPARLSSSGNWPCPRARSWTCPWPSRPCLEVLERRRLTSSGRPARCSPTSTPRTPRPAW